MGYVDSVPKCLRADAKFSHGTENYYRSRFTAFNGDPHRSNLAAYTITSTCIATVALLKRVGWLAPIPCSATLLRRRHTTPNGGATS